MWLNSYLTSGRVEIIEEHQVVVVLYGVQLLQRHVLRRSQHESDKIHYPEERDQVDVPNARDSRTATTGQGADVNAQGEYYDNALQAVSVE